MLKNENPLLKSQIKSLDELNKLYIKSDSIYKIEIDVYKNKVESDNKLIKKLKTKQRNTLIYSSAAGLILFILGIIL